jgi:CMP/dCMP kinase
MAVITISRQAGSGGDEIAKLLCQQLGCRFFDKTMMAALTLITGISIEPPQDLSEESYKVDTLMDRLFSDSFGEAIEYYSKTPLQRNPELSVDLERKLIMAAHQRGNIVIIGRGGQVVLAGKPDVLHVRVVAPTPARIRRIQEQEGLVSSEAEERVETRDKAAVEYLKRFHHADADDPLLYDLVINTAKVPPNAAVDLIVKASQGLAS